MTSYFRNGYGNSYTERSGTGERGDDERVERAERKGPVPEQRNGTVNNKSVFSAAVNLGAYVGRQKGAHSRLAPTSTYYYCSSSKISYRFASYSTSHSSTRICFMNIIVIGFPKEDFSFPFFGFLCHQNFRKSQRTRRTILAARGCVVSHKCSTYVPRTPHKRRWRCVPFDDATISGRTLNEGAVV